MTPEQYCQQKVATSGSTLYYSLLFLPPEERRAITALYAFCGEIEDAVNAATDPGVAQARLAWWRTELDAVFDGRPQHPAAQALAAVTQRYRITQARLSEIVDGRQMDLDYNRYPDFRTLEVYCRRVSGVAILSAEILGYSDPGALDYAQALGIALQLTTIIADIGEDARRNRIYVPLDELSRFGLSSDDLIALREDERFERLMAHQVVRARGFYERAIGLLPRADRRAQRSGLVLAAIQRTLLEEISALRGRTLNRRVALTPLRRFWIAWKTWYFA